MMDVSNGYWSDSDNSDDDHSYGGDNYGRGFAMIVTMTMMVGMMVAMTFVAVDDGGNYDRDGDCDDFCDSDKGSNDRTGTLTYDGGNDSQ